ncbi:cytochrome p450 81e8 [Quercus suber]|uniref:Cytochrome p450 81e8 n=1 Tax=Quercus suber TaxID=58331 RepID=A0AAW0M3R2_QUESU
MLLPFGAGRRGCPGEGLATRIVGLALGSLIQCFEWKRIGKEMVDMTERVGLAMSKAHPLLAKCKPRPTMANFLSQLREHFVVLSLKASKPPSKPLPYSPNNWPSLPSQNQETSPPNSLQPIKQIRPIVFLNFGSRPVLLISSPSLAEECLTKRDVVFANRPRLLAGKHLGYNYTSLTWAPYGDHWRNLRKIASLEILSSHRVQTLSHIRSHEVHSLIRRLLSQKDQPVDMKALFFELTLNVMMRMIAGKREVEEGRKIREIVTETFLLGV